MSAADDDDEHIYDDEDIQLIRGEKSTGKCESTTSSVIDQCIDASEQNGNLVALYTFSLAMVQYELCEATR